MYQLVKQQRWFLLLIAFQCCLSTSSFGDEKQGGKYWYGVMDAGQREFRFLLEPQPDASDPLAYQLKSYDEGSPVFKLDGFQLDKEKMQFELKQTKASYSGQVSPDGGKVSGKWKQAGTEFNLEFKRFDVIPTPQPDEIWSGTLNVLLQKLVLRFRVYKNAEGKEQVLFDSVTQKLGGLKGTRTVDGKQWTIEIKSLQSSFTGTINEDQSEVSGNWKQGGQLLPLKLKREKTLTETPIAAPKRPQNPKAPFPYLIEEVTFPNDVDRVVLAGTLFIPKGSQPAPAVILISGSGPQDRDETILDHKPFLVIADHLARNGIAVLRFDDRGTAKSTGNFAASNSQDFARDVEGALELLRKDSRINKSEIGLIGHSEGGLIAPMVAARRDEIAFIVSLAGTGVNGKEILLSQGKLLLKAEGVQDESKLKMQRDTQLSLIEAILNASSETPKEKIVSDALARFDVSGSKAISLEATKEEDKTKAEDALKVAFAAGVDQLNSPWFRFFLTYEPSESLAKVKCPLLALNGEKDAQVAPDLNLPAIKSALEKGGNSRFELVELPSLNHLFQTCKTGGLSEYQTIEETVAPVVLNKVTDWIQATLKSRAPK